MGQPRGRISRQASTMFWQDRLLLHPVTAWSEFSEDSLAVSPGGAQLGAFALMAGGQVLHGQAARLGICFETLPAPLVSQQP